MANLLNEINKNINSIDNIMISQLRKASFTQKNLHPVMTLLRPSNIPLSPLPGPGRTWELDRNAQSSLDIWMTVWPAIIIIAADARCCHKPTPKSCQTAVLHSETKILNTIAHQLSILSNPKCHCMPTYENCRMPSVKSEILKSMFKMKCLDLQTSIAWCLLEFWGKFQVTFTI